MRPDLAPICRHDPVCLNMTDFSPVYPRILTRKVRTAVKSKNALKQVHCRKNSLLHDSFRTDAATFCRKNKLGGQ